MGPFSPLRPIAIMRLSRRQLLAFLCLSSIGLFAFRSRLKRTLAEMVQRVAQPPLPTEQGTASLSASSSKTMIHVVVAVIDRDVELAHYRDYFEWRAENLPGYHAVYEELVATLNDAASAQGLEFASLPLEARKEIISSLRVEGRLDRLGSAIIDRSRLRFQIYVFQEILSLFARTDAYLALGYKHWPATPRGLDSYLKPLDGPR